MTQPNTEAGDARTAHQFARELLDGPDIPIVTQTLESIKEEGEYAEFVPPFAYPYTMEDENGRSFDVLMVSHAPSTKGTPLDVHDTMEQALAVCSRLEREGFGGDRVHFPLKTWAEEVVDEAQPDPINLTDFEGITPGPWKVQLAKSHSGRMQVSGSMGKQIAILWRSGETEPNARAIAAVPALIAEVVRLREEKERLQRAVSSLRRHHSNAQTATRHSDETNGRLLAENTSLRADIERLTEENAATEDDVRVRIVTDYATQIRALRADIATLEAQVEEIGRDKARLDWLEANALKIGWRIGTGDPFAIFIRPSSGPFATFRAAIDAATAKGEQG